MSKSQIVLPLTVPMMISDDYRERFRAEYWQLLIRYERLFSVIADWEQGKLDFTPFCPKDLLLKQKRAMEDYIIALEERAEIEGIDLSEIKMSVQSAGKEENAS